jgi:hypothetical protein
VISKICFKFQVSFFLSLLACLLACLSVFFLVCDVEVGHQFNGRKFEKGHPKKHPALIFKWWGGPKTQGKTWGCTLLKT